ncbi:hypothetical protein LINPERHAP1_LOCUS18346 [Linum perenne]
MISWEAGQGQGYTLNTDGSVRISEQRAAAGGCLRDSDGRVIDCFAANLGNCSITRAELTGVIIGLREANYLADFLANRGHALALGTHTIDNSESGVLYWAKYDLVGGSEIRNIFT